MKILKKPLIFIVVASILVCLIAVTIGIFSFSSMPEEIVLQLNNTEGVKTFGSRMDLIGLLISILVLICVNFILAEALFQRNRVLSFVLIFLNLLISISSIVIVSFITSLN